MTYTDIFILGWNLNAAMFVVNLFLAFNVIKTNNIEDIEKEHEVLNELKEEFDKYYPNRQYETLLSYAVPFTAFYRVLFKMFEMSMFFKRNQGARMYDFMVYKYSSDIQKAKRR